MNQLKSIYNIVHSQKNWGWGSKIILWVRWKKYFKDRVAKIFRGWGDEKNKVVGWEKFWGMGWQKNLGGNIAKYFGVGWQK